MNLTEEQQREARCDAGIDLLETCEAITDWDLKPVGNEHLGRVLQFVSWGWIDGHGITETGRAVLDLTKRQRVA